MNVTTLSCPCLSHLTLHLDDEFADPPLIQSLIRTSAGTLEKLEVWRIQEDLAETFLARCFATFPLPRLRHLVCHDSTSCSAVVGECHPLLAHVEVFTYDSEGDDRIADLRAPKLHTLIAEELSFQAKDMWSPLITLIGDPSRLPMLKTLKFDCNFPPSFDYASLVPLVRTCTLRGVTVRKHRTIIVSSILKAPEAASTYIFFPRRSPIC